MNKLVLAIAVVFVSAVAGVAQGPCKTLFAPEKGAFTLCPPESLHSIKLPDDPNAPLGVLMDSEDPAKNTIVITMFQVTTTESLRESVYGLIEDGLNEAKRDTVIKQLGKFTTASGTEGIRLRIENTVLSGPLAGQRSTKIFYVFQGPGQQQVVFNAAGAVGAAAPIAVADATIKTAVIKTK